MNIASVTTAKGHIAWLKNARGFLVRHGEIIALGLLIAMVSLINILWISQDTRPQPGVDPNWYLIHTFGFVDRLQKRGGAQLWQSVAGLSLGGRPPLYQLLSVPFIYLFGRSADAALSVNVIFEAILLLSTYGIGRLARNGKAGLLAAFLVATYPPIVGLSRIYRPHFAAAACVALSLWLLLLLLKTRALKVAWLFGASLGLGTLIHVNFLFALPAPTVVFGLYMLLFQTNPRRPPSLKETPRWLLTKLRHPFVLYGLLPAALIAVGLTASWYWPQRQAVLAQARLNVAGWGDVTYGFYEVPRSFWWFAVTAPGAISSVFAVLLGIGLVVGTIRRRLGSSVLVITFLAAYSGHALTVAGITWFHFASVLPVAAALTAVGVVDLRNLVFPFGAGPSRLVRVTEVNQHQAQITVTDLGGLRLWRSRSSRRAESDSRALTLRLPADTVLWDSIEPGTPLQITPRIDAAGKAVYSVRLAPGLRIGRLLSTALIVVCVVVAAFNFSVVTWGVGPWSRPIAIALGAPLNSRTCLAPMSRVNLAFCSDPALDEDWRSSDILRVILDDLECQAHGCHLVVVPRLNAFEGSVFAYYLMRDFPESRKRVSVSRADWGQGGASYNARWLTSDYLVYIPQQVSGRKFRVALTRFLESPPAVFADAHQEGASFALPGGWTAELIKRTGPLTLEEARLSIAALDIPEEGKSIMLRKVQKQLENEGN